MLSGPNGIGLSHTTFPGASGTFASPAGTTQFDGDEEGSAVPDNPLGRFAVAPRYFACYVLWDTELDLDANGLPTGETSDFAKLFRWQQIKPDPENPDARIHRTQYGRHIPYLDGVPRGWNYDTRNLGEPDFLLRRGKVKPLTSTRQNVPAGGTGVIDPNWFYPEYQYTFWKTTNQAVDSGAISDWYLYYGPNEPPNEPSQSSAAEDEIVLGPILVTDPDTDAHWSLCLVETKIDPEGPTAYPSLINYKLCPRLSPFPDVYPGNWFRLISDTGGETETSTAMAEFLNEYADAGPPEGRPYTPHWHGNDGTYNSLWTAPPQKYLAQPRPFKPFSDRTVPILRAAEIDGKDRLGFSNKLDWNRLNLFLPVYNSILDPWANHCIVMVPFFP